MALERQPTNEQRRLLKIAARMPLASVANLAPVLGLDEERVRGMLGSLRRGGWVTSVVRGMTERRQHRWFLTRRAVDLLYVTDHQHPAPREEARAAWLAAFHPEGELPEDYRERFALDHDHPVHLEDQGNSPFAAANESADTNGDGPDHEHPPWTATSRGIETSLRRLAMLEPVYRLAPDLLRSGRVNLPPTDQAASREARMTDFRLLRHGGFYHAVARYGPNLWTPFTYAGLHATERALRRKEQHRFWGVDCYSHEEDRYLRIGNRLFYEDPDQAVEPSAQVVVAHDAWARELARSTLSSSAPTLFCTPDGRCSEAVELKPSRDLVSDPAGHPTVGRPEAVNLWLRENPDMEAIRWIRANRPIVVLPRVSAHWPSVEYRRIFPSGRRTVLRRQGASHRSASCRSRRQAPGRPGPPAPVANRRRLPLHNRPNSRRSPSPGRRFLIFQLNVEDAIPFSQAKVDASAYPLSPYFREEKIRKANRQSRQ